MQRANNSRINKVRNKIKPSGKHYYKSVKHKKIKGRSNPIMYNL